MARRLLQMTLLAVAACGWPRAQPTASRAEAAPSAPESRVIVTVTRPKADQMRVEYEFPRAASELVFARRGPAVRAHWTSPLPGVTVTPERMTAPSPARRWVLELPIDDTQPEKDYRNFYPYTDRGLLFYTGHLAARPKDEPSLEGVIRFRVASGEHVVARGNATEVPMRGDGTYVYLGPLEPAEDADFVGVVDRGFPPALRARMDELLPRLFSFFADGLGRPESAEERPLLFATYHEHTGPGYDMGGGVMPPRVVNFNFGVGHDPDPAVQAEMQKTLAHEIAHLWNADLFSAEGEDATWMTEGSADALAYRALFQASVIDLSEYRQRYSDALMLCLLALEEGEPLSASKRPGHTRDFYTCGMTLTAMSAAASRMSLVAFLKEVYSGPNRTYDGARWFATVEAHGGKTDALRKMASDRLAEPAVALPKALREAGIAFTAGKVPSPYVQKRAGPFAVRALLSPSCVAALELPGNFLVEPRVTADGACGAAAKGDILTSFGGIDLATRGLGAFEAGQAQCLAKKKLDVGRKGKPSIEIPCAVAPRKPPPYFEIVKAID